MSPHYTTADLPVQDADHRVGFLLSLAAGLHAHGTSTQQIEDALNQASSKLGIIAQFFVTPTSLFAAFGPQISQRTYLMRVEPGDTDLSRLARLDAVVVKVLASRMTPAEGAAEIGRIGQSSPPYGTFATTLAFAAASAAACRFLGGGFPEIAVATALGLLTGLLALFGNRIRAVQRVFTPLASFLAAGLAAAGGVWIGGYSTSIAMLAGLIALLPGMMLTTAMAELAANHLSAGTARLSGAFIVFIGMGVGVAFGQRLAVELVGEAVAVAPVPLPMWSLWVALGVASLSFAVLLKALRRDIPWIMVGGLVGFLGSRAGSHLLGAEFGVFLGALSVAVGSNLLARFTNRPAAITLVPSALLLVPGSVGFRSVTALLEQEAIAGVDTLFQMLLLAISLVAGLLFANLLAPERRLG
ncbi:MAG: threonine/serine exporter family protein [Gemmatimonadota bacterium]|nr:threonine/serine exporter family protein [Gemmatimonadota bacterium]